MSTLKTQVAPKEKPATSQAVLVWILIVASSLAPAIILRQFVPETASEPYFPFWLAWVQITFLAVVWLVVRFSANLKPLSGFILALIAFNVGMLLVRPAILQNPVVSAWLNQASWGAGLVVSLSTKLISVVLMALTLIGSGIGRQKLYLSRGDPRAPAKPTPLLPGLKESRPWHIVARTWLPFYAVGLIVILGLQIRPDVTQFTRALIFLPAIILAAAVNAFSEEFQFRSMLLSRLEPVLGTGQAVLMTTVAFGIAHYAASNPSGPMGALLAGYLGWVAAKSMVETRGMVWAFLLHFLGDFVIYTFAAMAAV